MPRHLSLGRTVLVRLVDYLDKGASLGADAPCLTMDGKDLSYGEVQRFSYRIARGLADSDIAAGEKVAILSSNDPIAFASVFGISRAGTVWCPVNPRNEAAENQFILDAFDCSLLLFSSSFAPMVDKIRANLPKLRKLVCLETDMPFAPAFTRWLADVDDRPFQRNPVDDLALIPGTGGTTGKPKGVMLTGRNMETMTALTLMGYPFKGRPTYLALAPLTHAAGVLCFPIMTLGGRVVIMHHPDTGEFLDLIARHRVTHTFLPPTVIYMLLDHPNLESADLTSLQCFWYGAAPISVARLAEALEKIGPMAQLFGQTEAPMVISMMPPEDHYNPDGSIAIGRLSSAGRVGPLVQVGIMDRDGNLRPAGERGEIVVRGSLVMEGYYNNAEATAEVCAHGWHHTGDIGYLDPDNFLYIVDRAKDMIITGGFNVYSVEVENALQAHETIQDCAVVGLPDEKWGERIVAVVQPRAGRTVDVAAVLAFVKQQVGSVKTPKQIEVWEDLPRSKVGKVLKSEIRNRMLANDKIRR
jgi:fatty-acyl-CoA synthase